MVHKFSKLAGDGQVNIKIIHDYYGLDSHEMKYPSHLLISKCRNNSKLGYLGKIPHYTSPIYNKSQARINTIFIPIEKAGIFQFDSLLCG